MNAVEAEVGAANVTVVTTGMPENRDMTEDQRLQHNCELAAY